jgi:hypothetical protein
MRDDLRRFYALVCQDNRTCSDYNRHAMDMCIGSVYAAEGDNLQSIKQQNEILSNHI